MRMLTSNEDLLFLSELQWGIDWIDLAWLLALLKIMIMMTVINGDEYRRLFSLYMCGHFLCSETRQF